MKPDEYGHTPVLLNEVLHALALRADGVYVDCTFGRGGHSRAILERLGDRGRLLAFDRDPDAVRIARALAAEDPRMEIVAGSFSTLERQIDQRSLHGAVDGVLFDLGVSSPQLEAPERGFSFQHDGELDMRFDPETGISAAQWLAEAAEKDIAKVLREFGEERFARRIAAAIVRRRGDAPVRRTRELAELVAASVPGREAGRHPATRTFQAIRIFLNGEIDALTEAVPQAAGVLRGGGRLAVISFHSLEDRVVKRFMRREASGDDFPPELPVPARAIRPRLRLVSKAIRPGPAEVERNPRARSAVLRVAEKIAA